MNHKRIERLWRQEGLKVPKKQPKRKRLWLADGSCIRLRLSGTRTSGVTTSSPIAQSDGRAIPHADADRRAQGECLAIDVARSLKSEDVLERLSDLFVPPRGAGALRSDNGAEFTATPFALASARRREDALHRARQPLGKRLHRELQRQAPRRVAGARTVRHADGVDDPHRALAAALQDALRPHSSLGYQPPAPETIPPPASAALAFATLRPAQTLATSGRSLT